ncbi:MAG TPA: hypothetical protein VG073_07290 [Gaiellaceae bacterium]|nr:hypothetical protein [Gaiellaceae bacterium]
MSVIEQDSSPPSRWLHERRWRFALWIAVGEAIVVAVAHDVSRWTVLLLALIAFALYSFVGRNSRFRTLHEVSWIFGASQALALLAATLAFFVTLLAFIAAAIFAVVAITYFLLDRR